MSVVLVTRAMPEAAATAERVRERGHDAVISPVLEIAPTTDGSIETRGVQALLFTSAAGVRAVSDRIAKTIAVLCVGAATAASARAAGFEGVISADGAAADLAALAQTRLNKAGGAILHLQGEDVAGDIVGDLRAAGFDARGQIVYRAGFAGALSTEARAALASAPPRIESVLLHSARGAEAFARLVRDADLAHVTGELSALCMSARIADAAKTLSWREIRVSPAPQEAALLDLL